MDSIHGCIYKYADSDDLYMVCTIDISSCAYSVLVNLSTGYVNGPSSGAIGELVGGMIKVANSVRELIK